MSPEINLHVYGELILVRVPSIIKREGIAFVTRGVGTTRYPYEEEWIWTQTSQHIQELIQNELNT